MTAIELDRVEERTEEPAKAWRNKWFDVAGSFGGGEFYGWRTYPSAELAENRASQNIRDRSNYAFAEMKCLYLGAFPVSAP